jgi:hypothetical protein
MEIDGNEHEVKMVKIKLLSINNLAAWAAGQRGQNQQRDD